MFKIGNVEIENNIFLAPMAGVTDMAFRLVCKKWGAGLVYSEMISSKALHYNDKKTMTLLETHADEQPLAVQIFGNEPAIMAEAAQRIEEMGFKIIDINMGCPAPKVVSSGDGSALLKNLPLAAQIVRTVKNAVRTAAVTCKVRGGYDEFIDMAEVGKLLEQNGADAIAVHGRTRSMYYSGRADRSKITDVKRAVSIPVIGNGDIFCPEDAASMLEETGCDAVMVGRGSEGNPFIFSQIREYINEGRVITAPSDVCRLAEMKSHLELMVRLKGERIAVKEARKHIAWYTKGMKGSALVRNEVCKTESYETLCSIINEYANYISGGDVEL